MPTNPLADAAAREWVEAKRVAAESIALVRRPHMLDWRGGRSWTFHVMNAAEAHASGVCAKLLADGQATLAARYAHAATLLGQRAVHYRPGWEERRTQNPATCTYHGGCNRPADSTRDEDRCEDHQRGTRWAG